MSEERGEESLSLNFGEIEKKVCEYTSASRKMEKHDFSSFIQESEKLLYSRLITDTVN